ncbi:MAG: BON domain-containing protein [Acidobacteriota bacterium]
MKSFKSLVIVIFSVMIFTGCERYESNTNSTNSNANRQAQISDADLERAIEDKFDADAQIKNTNIDVDADVDTNSVTLSGTVDSQELRLKAVELAKSSHAGLIINDKIDVKPREVSREGYTDDMAKRDRERAKSSGDSIGDNLEDAWLYTKVMAKLIGDKDTPGRKINVDVKNQVVTLRGTVDSTEQKQEAERIAKATDGVKSVNNQLKVGKA